MTSTSRILVIEDDLAIRTIILELLRDEGYEASGVPDGRAGLDQLEGAPDLIVLDLMMPVMDGSTFLARKQEIPCFCDIPVIVLTARHDATSEIEAMGVSAIVAKPFDADHLLATVGSVLDETRKSQARSD